MNNGMTKNNKRSHEMLLKILRSFSVIFVLYLELSFFIALSSPESRSSKSALRREQSAQSMKKWERAAPF